MIRYHFDLYSAGSPLGSLIVRFTKLQSARYEGHANGTGSGGFTIRATDTEASHINPDGDQYVRVVREDTVAETEEVVGGWFTDPIDVKLLDRSMTHRIEVDRCWCTGHPR